MARRSDGDERSPDGLVEGGAQQLAAVLTETHAGHAFAVSALKPTQALATLDLPHLQVCGAFKDVKKNQKQEDDAELHTSLQIFNTFFRNDAENSNCRYFPDF